MCFRKFIHRLSCDSRPLFTTVFDGSQHDVLVNAFGEPRRCTSTCAADRQLPELTVKEKCPYHRCCRVSFVDIRCPELCCPEQSEKKGRLEDGISGLVSGPSYRYNVYDCSHADSFHVYIRDGARAVGPPPEWRHARYPYLELLRDDTVEAPAESKLFVVARLNLFRAGQRLLTAKNAHADAERELDSTRAQSDVPREVLEAASKHYRFTRSRGFDLQANYDDCDLMVTVLEQLNHGRLQFRQLDRRRLLK